MMRELDDKTLMFFDQHPDMLPLYLTLEEFLLDSFSTVNKRVRRRRSLFPTVMFLPVCLLQG